MLKALNGFFTALEFYSYDARYTFSPLTRTALRSSLLTCSQALAL